MNFGAIIVGDEILSGKRVDRHFARIAELLAARGLRLAWVTYLGDHRSHIAATVRRSMVAGDAVFCFGGIGNTPDDHTRQAVAEALDVDLVLHPGRNVKFAPASAMKRTTSACCWAPSRAVSISCPIPSTASPVSAFAIIIFCRVSRRWRIRWRNGRSIPFMPLFFTRTRRWKKPFC